MSKRTALLIGAGVGAVALGGAIYLLWRYTEDDDENQDLYRSKNSTSSRAVVIEVLIPTDQVGAVIGRGGENIKEIQRKTRTRIDFKDVGQGEEKMRLAVIRGSPDEAQLAEILIHQTLANQPRVETVDLMIPAAAVGRIIGRNGETIRDIQNRSRCKIEVERGRDAQPKKVTLRGSCEQIASAQDLIEEKVLECEPLKRRYHQPKEVIESKQPKNQPTVTPLFLTAENSSLDDIESSAQRNDLPKVESLKSLSSFDDVIEVYVSSIADPTSFFVQKVGPSSIALDKLIAEMTAHYEVETNREAVNLEELKVGDLVATQFPSDKNWYRARVVEILVNDYDEHQSEVDIDFVDFGDCQRKKLNEICPLQNSFLKLKFQAIECCLDKIKPSNGDTDWSESACDAFERLTHAAHWKVLLARIIKHDAKISASEDSSQTYRPCIDLVDASSNQDINIGEEMVRLGFAAFTNESASTSSISSSINALNIESPDYEDAQESISDVGEKIGKKLA